MLIYLFLEFYLIEIVKPQKMVASLQTFTDIAQPSNLKFHKIGSMNHILPIHIETISDLANNNMRFYLYCSPCNRWHQLDLDKFIKAGRGDFNYVNARFRCKECGGIAEKQIRPPLGEPAARHSKVTQIKAKTA